MEAIFHSKIRDKCEPCGGKSKSEPLEDAKQYVAEYYANVRSEIRAFRNE